MINMDPKAAAAKIRDAWQKEPPPVTPDDRHQLSFIEAVCKELGVEPTPVNTAHVAHLMAKAEIGQHRPDEYPKMLVTKDALNRTVNVVYPDGHELAGTPVVLHSSEEEDALHKDAPHLFGDEAPAPTSKPEHPEGDHIEGHIEGTVDRHA